MRLIDADEFIKEMNNRCESAIKWGTNAIADHNEEIKIRAEQAVATFCEASLTAKKMPTIESDPVKHGWWIPCNERLPEIGDTYIVTGIQKDSHEKEWHYFVDVASSHGGYIDDFWDTFNDWIEGQETHIIAWMPLPKPYKTDGVSE